MTLYIGIDGGGTKTTAVLCNSSGTVLSDVTLSGSNPNDIGIHASVTLLNDSIDRLLKAFPGSENGTNLRLFAGIAGALNHLQELRRGLQQHLPSAHIDVHTDATNLICCELPTGDGACLICGTGSACFVRHKSEFLRIGGWGYLLDSGGNGYTIGRDILEAALMAYDGRGEQTCLSDLIERFTGKRAESLITDIYEGGKPYIASFAPLLLEGIQKNDPVSRDILSENAKSAAIMLDTAYRTLQKPFTAVLGGGINQHFSPYWQDEIKKHTSAPVTLLTTEMPPVFGAFAKALAEDGVPCTDSVRREFKKTWNTRRNPQ